MAGIVPWLNSTPLGGKKDVTNFTSLVSVFFAGHFMLERPFHADILNTIVGHSTFIVNHTLFSGDKTIEESWLILYGNHEACSQILPFSSIWACDSLHSWIRMVTWPAVANKMWGVEVASSAPGWKPLWTWVTHHVPMCLGKDEDVLDDRSFISLGLWVRKMENSLYWPTWAHNISKK